MSSFYSYPPTFLETMLSCVAYLEECGKNDTTKEDVITGVEKRMSLMVGKLVAAPTCTAFCIYRERDERTF